MTDQKEKPTPKPDIDDMIFDGQEKTHSDR